MTVYDKQRGRRSSGGVVLVAGGACLAVWIVVQVVSLLGGGEVGLIDRLIPVSRASRSMLIEGQNVEMPASFFEYGAYGMAIGLLSVLATIANAAMRAGAALLRPDLRRLVDELAAARDNSRSSKK